jgi:sec-independent protein translocase protein TatA
MPNISIWEILLLLLVLLLVFGPKRLPEMGRSLGRGMREFKDSITGKHKAEEEDEEEEVAAIASPAVTTPTVEPTATVAPPPESKPLS